MNSFCFPGISVMLLSAAAKNEGRQTAEGEEDMDQVRIGKFIAELRKEKELTQRELAELIGISDRTVSKWECGNGMPEISMLMPLCQALQINVNELLSGERLSDDSYSRKAEENIMNLIQESENNRKQSKRTIISAVLIIVFSVIAVFLIVEMSIYVSYGTSGFELWNTIIMDPLSVCLMLLAALIMMSAAKMWKPFFRAFGIIFTHREYSAFEVRESAIAMRMLGNVWVMASIVFTVINVMIIAFEFPLKEDLSLSARGSITAFTFAVIPLVYGLLGKLLLQPIQCRLEVIAEKLYTHD